MTTRFTPAHRGGHGPPLVVLHGFTETWRSWQLALPALERRHAVLAPTLPGHAAGPPLGDDVGLDAMADALETAMDDAGLATAHLAGVSLGGHLALRLAARGRAETVVAFAPAGGWAPGDDAPRALLAGQVELQRQAQAAAPHVDAIAATREGRRRATALLVEDADLPADVVADLVLGTAACRSAATMVAAALAESWELDAERIACPVRIVWGTADRLLPWPSAAVRYRRDWLPHADWVLLDGVGHAPQLQVPLEAAELIGGLTTR